MKKLVHIFFLILYYGIAQHLPSSYAPFIGTFCNRIRIFCVKHIFKKCGKISTIDRKAYFGTGSGIEIGNYSGIGARCIIPKNTIIGDYVMMAPDIYIIDNNHVAKDVSTPMCFQGKTENKVTIIEDDVWLCARVMIMPGKKICHGSIIAAGSIVTKDVEPYSIMGGNPAKLIRNRIKNQ